MNSAAIPAVEVWTDERCFIAELLNDERYPEVSLARARVEPGITTKLHQLSAFECYVIECGQGLVRIGDEAPYAVGPGDTVVIPKNTPQQITNTSAEDLCFLCVCAPRFSQERYVSLE